jgi:hypothetical protein
MDNRKKNSGSTNMASKHDMAKNRFHRRTALECGFITGTCGREDQNFFIHAPPWPYRILSNFKIKENLLKPLSSTESRNKASGTN